MLFDLEFLKQFHFVQLHLKSMPNRFINSPEDGDINVPLDQVITVTFTAPVNPATISGQTIIVSNWVNFSV